ncbi:GNAT family N-acetyltransferase [Cytobacillus sp. IB215665]|uniref:GNAT family N-acetyltransferase n=1 Tax=Cytobacillus sp. IB215665 TaxID=3097357 RepID=UPI002A13298A|nr:GNAT family N-acetyltransferase [Cytobacillus sp. IB215665]MDX8367294.1 GNAT family N-acetyltransferase [Cytobacillus sp. IB215665]
MINYKINMPISPQDIAHVLQSSGIKRPYDDLDRIEKMFSHSNIVVSAWNGDELVGIARSITDYYYCCYLSDLAVSAPFQQRGIGKELIAITQQFVGDQVALILLSSKQAMDYYPNIGFTKLDNAFRIPRKH